MKLTEKYQKEWDRIYDEVGTVESGFTVPARLSSELHHKAEMRFIIEVIIPDAYAKGLKYGVENYIDGNIDITKPVKQFTKTVIGE